jgi:hypothetical protein
VNLSQFFLVLDQFKLIVIDEAHHAGGVIILNETDPFKPIFGKQSSKVLMFIQKIPRFWSGDVQQLFKIFLILKQFSVYHFETLCIKDTCVE